MQQQLKQQQQPSGEAGAVPAVPADTTDARPAETPRLLGVLLALRHLMAQMVTCDVGVGADDWLKAGSFGLKSTASSLPRDGHSG